MLLLDHKARSGKPPMGYCPQVFTLLEGEAKHKVCYVIVRGIDFTVSMTTYCIFFPLHKLLLTRVVYACLEVGGWEGLEDRRHWRTRGVRNTKVVRVLENTIKLVCVLGI